MIAITFHLVSNRCKYRRLGFELLTRLISPKFQPTVEARFEVKILKMCGLARAATWFSFICVLM